MRWQGAPTGFTFADRAVATPHRTAVGIMNNRIQPGISYHFALKTMPPHCAKQAVASPQLLERLRRAAEHPLAALVSLAGFGKTTLMVQLRRELLAEGAAVAWLSVERNDEAATLVPALLMSLATAAGIDMPERAAEPFGHRGAGLWAASEVLVKIHEAARPTWLLIDDLHQLADANAIEFVFYLIRNAPQNFHVVIASRTELPFAVEDLAAHGLYAELVTEDLRLRVEDTISFLRRRLGDDVDVETCALLHERTEGWPMALQIVTNAMGRRADVAGMVAGLSGAKGDIAQYFSQFVLGGMAPEVVAMLVRASLVKTLHPELCALLGDVSDGASATILSALEQNTGLVTAVDGGDGLYRMHPLFAEFLQSFVEALSTAEVQALHARAAQWFARRGLPEQAAEHAFAAGMTQQAMDWIEKRLRHLGAQGRLTEVLAWVDRLPPAELEKREEIQLTAAWACALCYRLDDAERLTDLILARPEVTPDVVLQANIVRSAVAIHCDHYDRAWSCLKDCDDDAGPLYSNSLSFIAIHTGFPDKARQYQQLSDGRGRIARSFYDATYGAFAVGLSYLVEGPASEAERVLRAALERAEANAGWRSLPAAMQAAGLAAACWELGAEEEARALLANRLDLIEQAALPDAVILAYVTLARYESQRGREGKTFDALSSLATLGETRAQPRLVATSLGEQIRHHAIRNRLGSCRALLAELEAIARGGTRRDNGLEAELWLIRDVASARVALLDFDSSGALTALDRAERIAARLRRGRDQITIRLMRACALSHDEAAARVLAEALSLAQSYGLVRAMADDWPAAADRLADLEDSERIVAAGLLPEFVERMSERCRSGWTPGAADARPQPADARAAQLSPREMEILRVLAHGRSNKEIARALDVGLQTVKWHMKNLLAKLGAANRRHAVDRARLLGILD